MLAFCLLVLPVANLVSQNSGTSNSLPVDSGYVTVDGGKLYYEAAGKGPNIVLLHDGMVPCNIWDEQFQWLAKNYRVVRYDRRAYGKSTDPKASYSDIDDLDQVFIQLKIDRAIIFGMSSGGGLAIDYTLKYPGKVRGLVLVGAVVSGYNYTAHMANRGGHMIPVSERSDQQKIHRYFVWEDPYEIYKDNVRAKERVWEWMKDYPKEDRGAGIPLKPADRIALKFLSEIRVSTLILVGEFDIPDVHAHSGAINAGINGSARRIIPGAGHLIPIEQPKLFNEAVFDYLKWFDPQII